MEEFQFHPAVESWFEHKFGSPTEPQQRGWPAIQSGAHTCLSAAPTGSGKTLAAFLASLDQLFREALAGRCRTRRGCSTFRRSRRSATTFTRTSRSRWRRFAGVARSEGRDVDVRAEVRTGDTPAAKRQSIIGKPPHILVTTPESLYLLLTSDSGRRLAHAGPHADRGRNSCRGGQSPRLAPGVEHGTAGAR